MSHSLFVAWRSGHSTLGRWGPVARLDGDESGYRFAYTRGARLLEGFRPFPDMPDLDVVYESDELFPLFSNRLLTRSRPEYEAFLAWGGFDPNRPPDPIAVLGVTEGRRATDSFEVFPCPTPAPDGCYSARFFVYGVRWRGEEALDRIDRLAPGEAVTLSPEPANEEDPHAVAVLATELGHGVKIGHMPRYLARDVAELLETCQPDEFEAVVQRVNPDAPLQHRVLCRVTACWPDAFHPCSGPEYQLVADELSKASL